MPNLAGDYLDGSAALAAFFAHSPHRVLDAVPPPCAIGDALCAAINRASRAWGATGTLGCEDITIVTGQQPGLLTGPLYTIYKAAGAIRVARETAQATGRPCTPVFWVAGDDHDFDEVRTAHLLTKQGAVASIAYAPEADVAALPMYRMPLDASLHALVDQAAAQAAGSEFRGEIAGFLHASLDASRSFSEWFARIMARLFADTPLVIFAPDLPEARMAARPVLRRALEQPLEATQRVNEAGARLAALGYPAQVVKGGADCNVFLEIGGRRRKLVYRDGAFAAPDTGDAFTAEALLRLLDEQPGLFSANVVLRGAVQQAIFPNTAAYLGGPGEIAYWAQLKEVFALCGQPMPAVLPRPQAVLTTLKLDKLRKRLGLAYGGLPDPPEAVLDRALRFAVRSPAREAFERHRARIEDALAGMCDDVRASTRDTAVAGAAGAVVDRAREALDRLERAVARGDAAQTETVRQQVARLQSAFAPLRQPQERVLNLFSFLFEHGWGLVPRLVEALDPTCYGLQEIVL